MPKCLVDYEPGQRWSINANNSYSSYNIAYQPQDMRLDTEWSGFHPLEAKVGMGINLHPTASSVLHASFLTDCLQTQG
jgi:hypothetical protein